jgi:voltage-gated potassium channel
LHAPIAAHMSAHVPTLRQRLHRIIFKSDTKPGRDFDILLLWLILVSVALVMLDSIAEVNARWGEELRIGEWMITLLFTLEYILRIWVSPRRSAYVTSFYGIIDLLAIIPSFLTLLIPGVQGLVLVRALRLTRVFRILNMERYVHEARLLLLSLLASRHRLIVFMLAVLAIVSVFGALAFIVETPEAGFTSIPRSIYWAIVTLTTVGYGDIAPRTGLGQMLAAVIMILGYSIIAIPTGIVSVEFARRSMNATTRTCPSCGLKGHMQEALYCQKCGHELPLFHYHSEEAPPEDPGKGAADG